MYFTIKIYHGQRMLEELSIRCNRLNIAKILKSVWERSCLQNFSLEPPKTIKTQLIAKNESYAFVETENWHFVIKKQEDDQPRHYDHWRSFLKISALPILNLLLFMLTLSACLDLIYRMVENLL